MRGFVSVIYTFVVVAVFVVVATKIIVNLQWYLPDKTVLLEVN